MSFKSSSVYVFHKYLLISRIRRYKIDIHLPYLCMIIKVGKIIVKKSFLLGPETSLKMLMMNHLHRGKSHGALNSQFLV